MPDAQMDSLPQMEIALVAEGFHYWKRGKSDGERDATPVHPSGATSIAISGVADDDGRSFSCYARAGLVFLMVSNILISK
jgi:hypothetical protein